jgi:polyferredoxin
VRTVLYVAIMAVIAAVMVYTLATRSDEGLSVIHDRNPIFVRLSDGALRNAYTVRILNKSLEPRRFALTATGLSDALVEVVGETAVGSGGPIVEVGPDQTREFRVLVTSYEHLPPAAAMPMTFSITDVATRCAATAADFFRGP